MPCTHYKYFHVFWLNYKDRESYAQIKLESRYKCFCILFPPNISLGACISSSLNDSQKYDFNGILIFNM